MRLLDARTITLETFTSENEVPRYAILSHTWGLEEVTFLDINGSNPERLRGYEKIKSACLQSLRDGIRYIWIDTCCIDKASSSELSETINSMFKWYQTTTVCYAYLGDVADDHGGVEHIANSFDLPEEAVLESLESQSAKSRWWTRGWTLQELIAPRDLEFYSAGFKHIGSKRNLLRIINVISGIDEEILLYGNGLAKVCVATKMSWAAARKTTRVEDMAYSLLGIFEISMTMLYGEGARAFTRLQEEIIKTTNDQSIFAWSGYKFESNALFAPHPTCFKGSDRIVTMQALGSGTEFSLTNAGLDIALPLFRSHRDVGRDRDGSSCHRPCWIAPLACRFELNFFGPIALELEESEEKGVFEVHVGNRRAFVINAVDATTPSARSVLIRQQSTTAYLYRKPHPGGVNGNMQLVYNKKCLIRWDQHQELLRGRSCYPAEAWNVGRDVMWTKRGHKIVAGLDIRTPNGLRCILVIGYQREEHQSEVVSWEREWVSLNEYTGGTSIQQICETAWHGETNHAMAFPGSTAQIEAKIRRDTVLGEEVFVVDISVTAKPSLRFGGWTR